MLTTTEKTSLDGFRKGGAYLPSQGQDDVEGWVAFGLRLLLDAGQTVRAARGTPSAGGVSLKADGSPVTSIDLAIEEGFRDRLAVFAPDARVAGEETGGTLPASGVGVAIDPVDGTWAFLAGTETSATTLAVFRDREPFLGMVSNPATGEIAYATIAGGTRLLQLSLFGEEDLAETLPRSHGDAPGMLVNVHPSRGSGALVAALHAAWVRKDVRMVRAPGGSPAWALVEAAKGRFVYVNLWSKQPAAAYDLAAGVLAVRQAGGDVTDLEGQPIDMLRHAGPFVASVDPRARGMLQSMVRAALSESQRDSDA
jgi:myo-inositol-1(or 4)-monophosphatase